MTDSSNDTLGMASNSTVSKMIDKEGESPEEVLYSIKLEKINRKGKNQQRAFLITDKAIYNLDSSSYGKCKRRVPLDKIESITVSTASDEFVVHIPDEYDYRFKSPNKDEICKCMKKAIKKITGKGVKTTHVQESALDDLTWTKDKAKNLSREEQAKIKVKLAAEVHTSDDKEGKNDETVDEVIRGDKKISIDSFDLLKVLGRGSFGKVMLVKHKETQQIYAMKILKKAMLVARQQVDHTKAERDILENIQHPFLMGLRYAFQTPSKLYMVMDYFKGGELFYHLKNKRRFSEAEAKIFVAEVALALGKLHSHNYIYRDLKPENILMDDKGHICITDFGLSKDISQGEATSFCGTPEYLAPEILKGGAHGKPVDWWSLGILLYELTVGIPPFYSQNVNEMYHKIQHGALRFPPFLTEECRELIIGLLNRNPDERLGSATGDVENIKAHAFFKDIDFEKLMKKELEPPYKPKVKTGAEDSSNFDKQFTDEQVVDSVVPDSELAGVNDTGFDGFTFVTQGDTLGK